MKKRKYSKSERQHMGADIAGLLTIPKGELTFITDDGKSLTDPEARMKLYRLQAEGHELIQCSKECYRFDKKKGCPGHIKCLKPYGKALQEIEVEYSLYLNELT